MLKRIAEVLCEMIAEAFLLGLLLGLLMIPKELNSFTAVLASTLPLIVVLFLHGYYLTRPLVGLLWRGKKPLWYASTVAALFAIHMAIGYARLKPDMTPQPAGRVVLFFACGAAIVLCCAFVGRRAFLNWHPRISRNNEIPSASGSDTTH